MEKSGYFSQNSRCGALILNKGSLFFWKTPCARIGHSSWLWLSLFKRLLLRSPSDGSIWSGVELFHAKWAISIESIKDEWHCSITLCTKKSSGKYTRALKEGVPWCIAWTRSRISIGFQLGSVPGVPWWYDEYIHIWEHCHPGQIYAVKSRLYLNYLSSWLCRQSFSRYKVLCDPDLFRCWSR